MRRAGESRLSPLKLKREMLATSMRSVGESHLTPLKFRRRALKTSMRSAGESHLTPLKFRHEMLKTISFPEESESTTSTPRQKFISNWLI
jgi:hypothetical protein